MTFNVPFKEAIDFHKQKLRVPTKKWDDITKAAHDRAFIVAGAEKDALLEDLHNAVIKSLEQGTTLADFGKDFDQIVAKHGWTGWTGEGSKAGQAWRKKIIYDTNMRTAYAAGRYKQMTEPDALKFFPIWEYKHSGSAHPRLDHKSWDGKCLSADDPFWQTHYPPNGWHCGCYVNPLTKGDLTRKGKSKLDNAPSTAGMKGISKGFDYAPGKSWADGLVPKYEHKVYSFDEPVSEPDPNLPSISHFAKKIKAPQVASDLTNEEYFDTFLAEFGAKRGEDKLFKDVTGERVIISSALFETTSGIKLKKYGRHTDLLRLAEALKDPDEIWHDYEPLRDATGAETNKKRLVRRYLRFDPEGSALTAFELGTRGWSGVTSYPPQKGEKPAKIERYFNSRLRKGTLKYRRGEEK